MATKTTTPKLTKSDRGYYVDVDGFRIYLDRETHNSATVWDLHVYELTTTAGISHTIGQRVLASTLLETLRDGRHVVAEFAKAEGRYADTRLREAVRAYQASPEFYSCPCHR